MRRGANCCPRPRSHAARGAPSSTDWCATCGRIQDLGFPLFAAGMKPVDSKGRGRVVAYNVPVQCGGVLVTPGDLVFADLDGIVTIPAAIVEEVVRLATEKVSRENHSRDELKKGAYLAFGLRQVRSAVTPMIVDVHTHVWERPAHLSETFIQDAQIAAGNPDLQIAVDLDAHWAAMAPVDRAIVLGFRARHVGVLVPNEYVAAYVDRHPEKLIGFCSVDPQDADALDQLEHAVRMLGLRGLKVAPIYQNVHPSDPRFVALMKMAEALGVPVLIHQGTTFCENVSLELANPVLLQPLALQFPRLRMVIAHLGHPWIAETLVLIRKHRHLYSDISALYYRPWQFYNALVMAMEYGVIDRLLFGTDYPFTTPASTIEALRRVNDMVEGTQPAARARRPDRGDDSPRLAGLLGLDG